LHFAPLYNLARPNYSLAAQNQRIAEIGLRRAPVEALLAITIAKVAALCQRQIKRLILRH
jgi:hypothetical protein